MPHSMSTVVEEGMKNWGGGAEYSYCGYTCTVHEAHSEHTLLLEGPGGMPPPRNALKIKCYAIESGGSFSQ